RRPDGARPRAVRASAPERLRGSGLLLALLRASRCAGIAGGGLGLAGGGLGLAGGRLALARLLLLRLLLVVLAAVVGDVEPRPAEDETPAAGRHLARARAADRALLNARVVDAVEHLELVPLAAAVFVGWHVLPSVRWLDSGPTR